MTVNLLHVLAKIDPPQIYDRVPLTDPTVVDQPWFFPSTAAGTLVLILIVVLLLLRWRKSRRERAKRKPAYILRMRMDSIAANQKQPGNAFYSELASIVRTAIGLCYGMSATPKTAREIETIIRTKDHFGRAEGALTIIRACETALFSGESPEEATQLVADARTACAALVPEAFSKAKAEDML